LPHLSTVADDLCVVKTLNTNAINHDPAKTFVCTGSENPGRPSMGAWLSYGLGTMNKDLPDFIVLTSAYWTGGQRNVQGLYSRLWGSGPLPTKHQGVAFQSSGDPVLFLSNPKGVNSDIRRKMLYLTGKLNRKHFAEIGDNDAITPPFAAAWQIVPEPVRHLFTHFAVEMQVRVARLDGRPLPITPVDGGWQMPRLTALPSLMRKIWTAAQPHLSGADR
ncbi:MAG: DUF1501 domain-containing protein, partial [Candidatus Puniceispirillum sp.]